MEFHSKFQMAVRLANTKWLLCDFAHDNRSILTQLIRLLEFQHHVFRHLQFSTRTLHRVQSKLGVFECGNE